MLGEVRNPCTGERAVGVGLAAAAQKYDNLSAVLNEVDLVELTGQLMLGGDVSSANQLPICYVNSSNSLVLRHNLCIGEQAAGVSLVDFARVECNLMSPLLKMDLVEPFGVTAGVDTSDAVHADQLSTLVY